MKLQTCLLASLVGFSAQAAPANLVVHEWGTFTSLQDEAGAAIGGINTDDEPVPKFVHRMAQMLVLTPTEVPPNFFQGAPRCHPDVTMRLETPVIYFHPGATQTNLPHLDMPVKFRGGWLSEFFPNAELQAPGLQSNVFRFGPLPPDTVSELSWLGLKLGGEPRGPETTEHVWLAPRAVKAAAVQTTSGESEKFLFYRGVANIPAPLRISRADGGKTLEIRTQQTSAIRKDHPLQTAALWLTEILPSGQVAFRTLNSLTLSQDTNQVLMKLPASFDDKDFSKANLTNLRSALKAALVKEGLYEDEALALLNTWELSYFKSPGMRLFFLVPRAWTDYYLPLEISTPAEITRVMVGRIELVTPRQRELLQKIAAHPAKKSDAEWQQLRLEYYKGLSEQTAVNQDLSQQAMAKQIHSVNDGRSGLASLGISVPPAYQAYLDLGRFRNALLLDEQHRRPTPDLKTFIEHYGLIGFHPAEEPAQN